MASSELERERFAVVLFYGIVLLIGYLAFQVISPFLVPLAWSAIFAMVLSPVNWRLASRIGKTWAAVATTIATFLMIVIPAIIVGTLLVHEVSVQIQSANVASVTVSSPARLLQQAWELLRTRMPYLHLPDDPTTNVQEALTWVATFAAGRAASILTNIATFVFQLFVMLFGLFFFLRDSTPMVTLIREMLPFEAERRDRIVDETHDLVVATVGSTFAVAVAQGVLTGVTLGLLGFSAPVFWGVMTSFTSLLPVVGSGVIWGPAAIWLFLSGDIVRGVILVVVGMGVVGTVDQAIRQVILTGRTTMHGLLVFISLMGGVAAFGFIGLVAGPVVVAAMATLLGAVLKTKPARKTTK